jgi:hypothetical protein
MKAFVRAGDTEHALHGPLSQCLLAVSDHLGSGVRSRSSFAIRSNVTRTPGEHVFDRHELLQLVAVAHALLAQPPEKVRRMRRVPEGPLPTAERIGLFRDWLTSQPGAEVIYDLWRSSTSPLES